MFIPLNCIVIMIDIMIKEYDNQFKEKKRKIRQNQISRAGMLQVIVY